MDTDIPLIDGPCADEPDQSCSDPANGDENGHGTHVAGIIAASGANAKDDTRGVAPGAMLFPGTILAASAIAVLNVLLSSMVKRRWPERAGLLVGIYLTTLSVGAILSSLLSVPLYRHSGGSVRLALGVWALPAALAVLLWLPQLRYRTAGPAPGTADGAAAGAAGTAPARAGIKVYRYALAWQVTAFMGLQSLLYYAALSWLPSGGCR